jgi:hypothetical protein
MLYGIYLVFEQLFIIIITLLFFTALIPVALCAISDLFIKKYSVTWNSLSITRELFSNANSQKSLIWYSHCFIAQVRYQLR